MRKKRNNTILAVLLVVVVIVFIIAFLNTENLKDFATESIQRYGYVGVFVFSFLADSLEQPIGAEVVASLGYLSGLNIITVFIISVIASSLGATMNFYIGKKWISDKIEISCQRKKYFNYCKLFHKYDKLSLAIASLSPVPYVFFCWLVGAFQMKFRDFVIFGLITRAIRIAAILWFVSFIF